MSIRVIVGATFECGSAYDITEIRTKKKWTSDFYRLKCLTVQSVKNFVQSTTSDQFKLTGYFGDPTYSQEEIFLHAYVRRAEYVFLFELDRWRCFKPTSRFGGDEIAM